MLERDKLLRIYANKTKVKIIQNTRYRFTLNLYNPTSISHNTLEGDNRNKYLRTINKVRQYQILTVLILIPPSVPAGMDPLNLTYRYQVFPSRLRPLFSDRPGHNLPSHRWRISPHSNYGDFPGSWFEL